MTTTAHIHTTSPKPEPCAVCRQFIARKEPHVLIVTEAGLSVETARVHVGCEPKEEAT